MVEDACYTISLRWCSMRPAIQKLFGSFKGDAFDKRVLPFFMSVMIFRLVNYRFDDGPIETKIICLR